jgi:para-nitrobenzyl esterase
MKKVLLGVFAVSLFTTASLHAQEGCGTGRYNSEVFPTYTLTSDIVYGNDPGATSPALKLDVYQPTGDVATQRPLIILAHGGSFISGNKTADPAVTESCIRFAKMGYVTASINYTLGFEGLPPSQEQAARTVYKTARQMKAAIRFFRKDAATTNTYKINPNLVFIGGNSAGAILALHAAYLDQYSELPVGIDTVANGGMAGNEFGNPGYSSNVSGVINMAGALGDTTWMLNNTSIPVVSAHGNADGTVPFGSAIITLFSIPILPVDGSGSIDIFTTEHGMNADLLVFPGDDHCPWNSNALKMTQVITHTRDFLYPIVCNGAGGVAPVADFTADQTNITAGSNVTFTQTSTNSPYGYTWTISPTTGVSFVSGTSAASANPVVKFSTAGTYTVILNAVNNGGSNTVTKTSYITVVNGGVSINESEKNALSVFPNPATESIFVTLTDAKESISYKLIDLTGKTVLSGNKKVDNGMFEVGIENLSNGVYTMQVTNGNQTKTSKVVVKK